MVRSAVLLVFLGLCSCSTSPGQKKGLGYVLAQNTPALTSNSPGVDGGSPYQPIALALAQFNRDPSTSYSCMLEHISAACVLVTCPQVSPILDAGSTSTTDTASAGVITLSGGREVVTLVPEGGVYSGYLALQQLWDGGESLTFHAAGGEVPAFDVTVVAPAAPTMVEPVIAPAPLPGLEPDGSVTSSGLGSTISRSQDLVFQWTGGTASTNVQVAIGAGGSSVQCTFDAGAGMGVVPAAILGRVSSGAGALSARVYSTATVNSVDWSTTVIANTVIGDVKGQLWPGGSQGGSAGIELQ